jgi:hypothetical protein
LHQIKTSCRGDGIRRLPERRFVLLQGQQTMTRMSAANTMGHGKGGRKWAAWLG